jgi:ribosomal protein S18 acetylase RimI-like enzyme
MNDEYIIRNAGQEDCAFIAEAIIAAEKSGTEKMSLSSLFDLTEKEVAELLIQILNEESSGSEFSLNCFLITEHEGKPVSAVAGWIENVGVNISSRMIKTNLLYSAFPAKNILVAHSRSGIVKDIQIEREKNTLQIEYVYTIDKYRGKGLAKKLIDRHISNARTVFEGLRKVQVQVFKNNVEAVSLYECLGFVCVQRFISTDKETMVYLPGDEKVLMEKIINV